jgi:hypothetical protein
VIVLPQLRFGDEVANPRAAALVELAETRRDVDWRRVFVTTVGNVWAIGSRMTVSGIVSAGEIGTTSVLGLNPIFWMHTRLPPSGRNASDTVPVFVVSAVTPANRSVTSAPSIGWPV